MTLNERNFAEDFNSFWHETLPMLTPAFMAVFNQAYTRPVLDSSHRPARPVERALDVTDYGVVAEMAFILARLTHELGGGSIVDIQSESMRSLVLQWLEPLFVERQLGENMSIKDYINESDWTEARLLSERYLPFLALHNHEQIEFAPPLAGWGFLGACTADISIGETLFEVKTVTRNFAGRDLRQLLTYLALQFGTGTRRWVRGGLFNPRRALLAEFSVDFLLFKISGGKSAAAVFEDILSFLSSRDIVVDSAF